MYSTFSIRADLNCIDTTNTGTLLIWQRLPTPFANTNKEDRLLKYCTTSATVNTMAKLQLEHRHNRSKSYSIRVHQIYGCHHKNAVLPILLAVKFDDL